MFVIDIKTAVDHGSRSTSVPFLFLRPSTWEEMGGSCWPKGFLAMAAPCARMRFPVAPEAAASRPQKTKLAPA